MSQPAHPDQPRQPDPADPNATTASGQPTPQTPPATPPSSRQPEDLFARIDQLEEFVKGLPDKLTESWKQQNGVHNPPPAAPPQGSPAAPQGPAQSPTNPTDQQTGTNGPEKKSPLAKWWFGE